MHCLFRLRREKIGDAVLKISDGFSSVSFRFENLFDVIEPVDPTFKLDEVGSLHADCKVHGWLSVVDEERKSMLLKGRNVCKMFESVSILYLLKSSATFKSF